jgi:hypothetical protein
VPKFWQALERSKTPQQGSTVPKTVPVTQFPLEKVRAFEHSTETSVEDAFRTLLQMKHLYQSLEVEMDDARLRSLVENLAPQIALEVTARARSFIDMPWWPQDVVKFGKYQPIDDPGYFVFTPPDVNCFALFATGLRHSTQRLAARISPESIFLAAMLLRRRLRIADKWLRSCGPPWPWRRTAARPHVPGFGLQFV